MLLIYWKNSVKYASKSLRRGEISIEPRGLIEPLLPFGPENLHFIKPHKPEDRLFCSWVPDSLGLGETVPWSLGSDSHIITTSQILSKMEVSSSTIVPETKDKTSGDYYWNSYAHFGTSPDTYKR